MSAFRRPLVSVAGADGRAALTAMSSGFEAPYSGRHRIHSTIQEGRWCPEVPKVSSRSRSHGS